MKEIVVLTWQPPRPGVGGKESVGARIIDKRFSADQRFEASHWRDWERAEGRECVAIFAVMEDGTYGGPVAL